MAAETLLLLESFSALAVLVAAIALATWWLRRLGVVTGRGMVEVIARTPLEGSRAIYLVRVGQEVIVVGAAEGSIARLGTTTMDAIGASSTTAKAQPTFGEIVAKLRSSAVERSKRVDPSPPEERP